MRSARFLLAVPLLLSCGDDTRATAHDATIDMNTDDSGSGGGGGGGDTGDGIPTGAVSFFETACPSGWAAYDAAIGRTIVSAVPTGERAVGAALMASTNPPHAHAVTATVALAKTGFVAAAGGANAGLASDGTVSKTVTSSSDAATVPWIAFPACKKTAMPGTAAPQRGLLVYLEAATCPAGWNPALDATGRYIVGRMTGAAGATFGGAPLAPGELRTHTHVVTGAITAAPHAIGTAGSAGNQLWAAAGAQPFTSTTSATEASLPYVQLLACVAS